MKLLSATIQNFMRLELVELKFDGAVQEITGENEAGKSSALIAFAAALGGKKFQPKEPIRRGAKQAKVKLVTDGGLIVEKIWKKDRLAKLIVSTKAGARFSKGQAKLDEIVGGLSFDPMGFEGMKDAEQRETLLGLAGIDLEAIEDRREAAYADRREIGRDLRAVQSRLDGARLPKIGTPDEEVSISDLSEELKVGMDAKERNDAARRKSTAKHVDAQRASAELSDQMEEISRLEESLASAKLRTERLSVVKVRTENAAKRATKATAKLVDPDLESIQERMQTADSINAEVRQKVYRNGLTSEVETMQAKVDEQQAKLDAIATEKEELLENAEMPVKGLGITDDGVTFEGLPLSQASMSRRIRICTAISAALDPDLRIALVRSGNDLSDTTLAEFYSYCAEHDLQAIVERISGITKGAIVIEEGKVAS